MNKPKGGRGKKADYETKVIRLPGITAMYAAKMADNARDLIEAGEDEKDLYFCCREKSQAITLAQSILKQKLNARKSLEKLLQLLYDSDIEL